MNLICSNDAQLSSKDATPDSKTSSKMTPIMKIQAIKDTRTRKATNVIQVHGPDKASQNLDL